MTHHVSFFDRAEIAKNVLAAAKRRVSTVSRQVDPAKKKMTAAKLALSDLVVKQDKLALVANSAQDDVAMAHLCGDADDVALYKMEYDEARAKVVELNEPVIKAEAQVAKWQQILNGHNGAVKNAEVAVMAAQRQVDQVNHEYKNWKVEKAQKVKARNAANARKAAQRQVDQTNKAIKKACADGNVGAIPGLNTKLTAAKARLAAL